MKRYYRINVADNMWNGEGWSVNEFYEQPYVIGISEAAEPGDILKALKDAGLLRKRLRYQVENMEELGIYIYYLADFQVLLHLRPIAEEALDRECRYRYGIQGRPTEIIEVKVKGGRR